MRCLDEEGGLLIIRQDEGHLVLESVDDAVAHKPWCGAMRGRRKASRTICWSSVGPMRPVSDPAPNSGVVLDASAVLALLFGELGADVVRTSLRAGIIGAVNLAEVLGTLSDHGVPAGEAAQVVALLGLEVVPMTEAQARRSADIRVATRSAGLSLGDRACLAPAAERGVPALTADRGWSRAAEAAGVGVQMIR